MTTMTKAHQIRKEAAAKWNCEVSEICFAECLRMAWNNEELEMTKECTKEIWNQAASIHVRGQKGLMTLVNRTASRIDSTDFLTIANHLYNDFLSKKDKPGAASHFGLYLNLLHK